jgi:hypothetical protein
MVVLVILSIRKYRLFAIFGAHFKIRTQSKPIFQLLLNWMLSFTDSKEKMYRVSARKLSIYNFAWGLLKATKKVNLMPQT